MPNEVFGEDADSPEVFASNELSEQFGEAIYIFEDERDGQLYYSLRARWLLPRKLM